MGGGSAQTVGYKYYLGMHMVLCHGPIDHIANVRVDDRIAWEGFNTGGDLTINKEGLFGGEEREGGVSGVVEILMGEDAQTQNSYLQSKLGTDIPGFRGVVSAILKQTYLGLNPYIKPWAFRAQRIYENTTGEAQWYPGTAPIGYTKGNVALYLVLDYSGSMNVIEPGNGLTRLVNMKTAVTNALAPLQGIPDDSPIDIGVVAFGNTAISIERFSCGGQDITDIIDWIDIKETADVGSGNTDFGFAYENIEAFYAQTGTKQKISFVITDGAPAANIRIPAQTAQENIDEAAGYLFAVIDIISYGFNIDLVDTQWTEQLDNTPADGVPVVAGGDDSALTNVLSGILYSQLDMNPSHIIRECLTDSEWGMGYPEADMDDGFFTIVADQLLNEAMGISLLWDKQMPIEDFIQEIARHINATLYVDRVTGLFTLKLIRNDYDEGTLLILDPTNIAKLSDYNRQDPGEAVNSVTVVYWDHETGKDATVTADDIALIQAYGTVINTTIQYPGFTNKTIAGKVAARDLKTFSSPLLNCTIEANREASSLNIGDVFKLVWPDYHTGFVIMRVQQIAFGGPGNNRVRINASEDIFALPDAVIIGTEEPAWVDIQVDPTAPPIQIVEEISYYAMVVFQTQLDADTALANNNDLGYIGAAAGRSSGAINAQFWVDDSSGYVDGAVLDFSPFGQLNADLSKFGTSIILTAFEGLDEVVLGTIAQIGTELIRIDALDTVTGVATIGRGLLDTIPVKHSLNDYVLFLDEFIASDQVEYVASDIVKGKVLPSTSNGTLDLAAGIEGIVTMASRAFSPYRPANFNAGGFIDPDPDWEPVYPVLLEWDQRNRLLETGGNFLAWEDGVVAHEVTTQYSLQIDAYEEDQVTLISNITTDVETDSDYSLTEATLGAYSEAPFIKVTITAQRDGYDSYQSPVLFFRSSNLVVFSPPTDYVAYWTMDDADVSAPTINDVSGTANIHNATMVNTPTPGEVGQKGEAVLFELVNSEYATLVEHADLKPANVTVAGWIKTTNALTQTIIQNWSNNSSTAYGGYYFRTTSGYLSVHVSPNTGIATVDVDWKHLLGTILIDDGNWHHVAFTYDGATLILYVDGILDTSVPFTYGLAYGADVRGLIGRKDSSSAIGDYFDGPIDDLKLFTRAITEQQLKNTYLVDTNRFKDVQDYIARWELENATTVTKPVDFVEEWKLDSDGSGTNAAHPATLVGSPSFAEGFVDNAMVLNGSSQYATIVDHANLKPTNVTVCAWITTTNINGMVLQHYSRNTAHAGYYLFINGSGGLTFEIGSNTGTVLNVDRATLSSGADDLVNDGNWRHVCGTYDGTTLKVYVDGRLTGSIAYAGGLAYDTTVYGRIGVFSAAGSPQFYFNGSIDGAKIFNYAATDGQVKALSRLERDATYKHHHGMVSGSPISSLNTGKIGSALTLDGTDDFIIIKDHADLKPTNVSITAWVKSSNALDEDCIFQSYAAATNKAGIRLHLKPTGEVNFTVGKNTGNVLSTDYENAATIETIKDGEWHHIVATFDGTDMKIYLDGLLSVTVAFSGSIGYEATNYIRIGTHNVTGTELWHFNGDLDDTRLYDRALTPLEAYRVYASRIVAPASNFTAEWTMDDVVGTLLNETNNNHDATLVGTPTFAAGWERDAMTLNGSTQYATVVPDVALRSASITIAAWVKSTSVVSSTIFSNFDAVSNIFTGYYFGLSASGRARVYICKGTGAVSGTDFKVADSTTPVNDGRWHHIAVTFQSTDIKVYVNGVLETTTPWANALVYNGTEEPQIGCREFVSTRDSYFNGSVDKLQFFNRAVVDSGIEAMAGVIVQS